MRITCSIDGIEEMDRRLLRFSEKARDLSDAWDEVADVIMEGESRLFDTQGRAGAGGWAALAPATVADKARRGADPRVLHDSGALRASLTERGASGQVLEVRPDGLRFGTSVAYAAFHQHGTSRMPARPPLRLSETTRRKVVKVIQRAMLEDER